MEEELKEIKVKGRWYKRIFLIIILIAILIYLATGVYQVGPSEVAVIKTFGKYSYTASPGIHLHFPFPFQSHVIVDVRTLRKIEIGFRTVERRGQVNYLPVPEEASMITGDENMVDLEAVIQYRIVDPVNFVFNVIDDYKLVKFTVESVLRERVALNTIDTVLTSGRDKIAMETAKIVQDILNEYNSGIKVENVYLQEVTPPEEVVEAFDDVNNAKQDKEKMINEARRYYNDLIPKAQGDAEKLIKDALGYAYEKVTIAKGEAERFLRIYREYKEAKDITRKKILLDALKELLNNASVKMIISSNSLNIMNLTDLMNKINKAGDKK